MNSLISHNYIQVVIDTIKTVKTAWSDNKKATHKAAFSFLFIAITSLRTLHLA